jgi:hypothetical protein
LFGNYLQGGHYKMADNDFPKILKAFIVITLFAFLIIGFSVGFIDDIDDKSDTYNKSAVHVDEFEEKLGADDISDTISSMDERADAWQQSFYNQNIFSTIAGIIVTGMFSLAKTMATFILFPFKLISGILTGILGVPPVVTTIINVLIVVTIIFGIWSLLKTGK